MAVEIFTKEQFEQQALPKAKGTNKPLWESLGLIEGEYTYLVKVHGVDNIGIEVRSSVHSNGISAERGKDSIRCWIVDVVTKKPWGSKIGRWTTRITGWGERTLEVIRTLYSMALKITTCPHCKSERLKVFKVKKEGPNKGKLFLSCPNEECSFNRQPFPNKILGDEDGEVTTKQSVVVDPRHGAVHEKPCHKCGGVVKTFIAQNGKPENVGKLFASCQGKDEQPSCGMFEWCDDSAPEPATMVGLAVEIPADQEEELKKFLDRIGGRISF
jgi:hypothetical protein